MSDLIYIGDRTEILPFRLLGIPTLTPAGTDQPDWIEDLAGGGYQLVMVSEGIYQEKKEDVESLFERLRGRALMTIVPDPLKTRSGHLDMLRKLTIQALGVDTWTRKSDTSGEAGS
jgi:vacuolar-type H+-ATPase subunit F/Vma7